MKKYLLILVLIFIGTPHVFAQGKSYNTSRVFLDVYNNSYADPVRMTTNTNLAANEIKKKLNIKSNQTVAIICEGKFPFGYIADDVLRRNGLLNNKFSITKTTTVLDICHQMEDRMRRQNPSLFK